MKLIRELDLNKVFYRPDWMEIEYSTNCTDPKEEINYTITISTYGEAFLKKPRQINKLLVMSGHINLDKRIAIIKSNRIKKWEDATLVYTIDKSFNYSKDPETNKLKIMQVELLDIILGNCFPEFQEHIYIAPHTYPFRGVDLAKSKNPSNKKSSKKATK